MVASRRSLTLGAYRYKKATRSVGAVRTNVSAALTTPRVSAVCLSFWKPSVNMTGECPTARRRSRARPGVFRCGYP